MTQEQRERMEFYASRGTQLAIAVRAALAEIDALRKDRERLEKLVNRSSRLTLVHWEDGTVTIFDDMTGNKMSVGNDLREAIDTIPEEPCRS